MYNKKDLYRFHPVGTTKKEFRHAILRGVVVISVMLLLFTTIIYYLL